MHLLRKGEFVDIKRRSIAQINELFPLIKNLDEQTTKNIFTANRGYQCLHCPAYKPCYNDRENGLLPLPKRNGQVALFRDEDIKPFIAKYHILKLTLPEGWGTVAPTPPVSVSVSVSGSGSG